MPNARKYQIQAPYKGKRRHPNCMRAHGEEGFPHDLPHFAPYKDQEGTQWTCHCYAVLWPGTFICPYGDVQLPNSRGVVLVQEIDQSWRKATKDDPVDQRVYYSPAGAEKALAGEI